MQAARIELLQRMPIFGGIRTETLQFLVALCPVVSVSTSEFYFREHDEGDAMFVLEMGKVMGRSQVDVGQVLLAS